MPVLTTHYLDFLTTENFIAIDIFKLSALKLLKLFISILYIPWQHQQLLSRLQQLGPSKVLLAFSL